MHLKITRNIICCFCPFQFVLQIKTYHLIEIVFLCGNVFYFSTKISLRLGFGDTVYKKVLIFYQKVYSFPPSLLLQLLLILTKPSPSLIFLILTLFRNHQISFCLYNDMFDNKNCSHLFQGNIPKRKKVLPQNDRIKLFLYCQPQLKPKVQLKLDMH